MNCLALLCAFYLDAGVMAVAPTGTPPPGHIWIYDRNRVANPYGVLAVGLEFEPSRRLSWRVEYRHESSLATRQDLGENSVGAFVRWRPWRK